MRPILLILIATACVRPADKPQKEEKMTIAEFTRSYVVSCQDVCQLWGIKKVSLSSKGTEFYSTCECNDPSNIGTRKIKPPVAMLQPKPVDTEPIEANDGQGN